MNNVIPFDYKGQPVLFTHHGWINATKVAGRFGKEPKAWLRQIETVEYLLALASALGAKSDALTQLNEIKELDTSTSASRTKVLRLSKQTGLVKVVAGSHGGTWLHPKLATVFARWLSVDFAVWCDLHIDAVLRGSASALQEYDRAHSALETRKEQASAQGQGLAQWRHQKQPLQKQVEYWREQLQLPLNLKRESA